MNGWDVLNEALKLLGPSSLTAYVALKIAKSSRSHEESKERRKRRQDTVEIIAELFEQANTDLLDQIIVYEIGCHYEDLPPDEKKVLQDFVAEKRKAQSEKLPSIRRSVGIIRARVGMLGAMDAQAAFDAYTEVADKIVKASSKTDTKTRKQIAQYFEQVQKFRPIFVSALAKYYRDDSPVS